MVSHTVSIDAAVTPMPASTRNGSSARSERDTASAHVYVAAIVSCPAASAIAIAAASPPTTRMVMRSAWLGSVSAVWSIICGPDPYR